jgi:hypothetical protein
MNNAANALALAAERPEGKARPAGEGAGGCHPVRASGEQRGGQVIAACGRPFSGRLAEGAAPFLFQIDGATVRCPTLGWNMSFDRPLLISGPLLLAAAVTFALFTWW